MKTCAQKLARPVPGQSSDSREYARQGVEAYIGVFITQKVARWQAIKAQWRNVCRELSDLELYHGNI